MELHEGLTAPRHLEHNYPQNRSISVEDLLGQKNRPKMGVTRKPSIKQHRASSLRVKRHGCLELTCYSRDVTHPWRWWWMPLASKPLTLSSIFPVWIYKPKLLSCQSQGERKLQMHPFDIFCPFASSKLHFSPPILQSQLITQKNVDGSQESS